jgi:hypothetical protein
MKTHRSPVKDSENDSENEGGCRCRHFFIESAGIYGIFACANLFLQTK